MTEYHPSYAARVRDLSIAGLKDTEIARILGISTSTMQRWGEKYPDFLQGWKDGKLQADAQVVGALFKRACGFTQRKWKETKDGMMAELVVYPPDTAAAIFWLTNRQSDNWRSKIEVDADIAVTGTDSMSEIEMARRIAFALSKATHALIEGNTDGKPSEPEAEQSDLRVNSDDDGF